jgi:hypothetical protein
MEGFPLDLGADFDAAEKIVGSGKILEMMSSLRDKPAGQNLGEIQAAQLPTFMWNGKAYTVDERLDQFRYLECGELPEYIEFDSDEGGRMYAEYLHSLNLI